MSSHEEYLNYLLENPEEINYFLNKFTINYTHFFRNNDIFKKFEEIIKQYTKSHKNTLRIWSAPCATGEEPYSIAMLLEKIKKETKNFPDYIVVASDVDKTALDIAKAGVYGDYSIHELPKYYYINYFTKKNTPLGPKYSIAEEIKKKVAFIEEDIIGGHKKNIRYDVIFCRNFFIYMNKPSQEKLLRMLERQLCEGGILILGKTEMIMNTSSSFESIDTANHFYIKGKMKHTWVDKHPIIKKEITPVDVKAPLPTASKFSESIKKKAPVPAVNKLSKVIEKNAPVHAKNRLRKVIEKNAPVPAVRKLNKVTERKPTIPLRKIEKKVIKPKEKKVIKRKEKKVIKPKEKKIVKKLEEKRLKPVKIKVIEPIDEEINKFPMDDIPDIKDFLEIDSEKPDERIERYLTQLELKGVKLERLIKKVQKQELKVKQRRIHLDQKDTFLKFREREVEDIEVQLNQRIIILGLREKELEQKEADLSHREKRMEIQARQIENQAQQFKEKLKDLNIEPDPIDRTIEEDSDIVVEPNIKGEINLTSGHYSVLNAFNKKNKSSKFSIYGLSSGIGLILRDEINRIYAMSHISLPKSLEKDDSNQIKFPHKYVNTSVKDLLDKIMYHGANRENIDAIVIGGAKNIDKKGSIYQENIDAIKNELSSHTIPITKNFLGGISERSIIYDTKNNLLYIKNDWEEQFRKINL